MPDRNGRFKGAAYPHIPWETEADRRRALRKQAAAEAAMLRAIKKQEEDDMLVDVIGPDGRLIAEGIRMGDVKTCH